MIFKAVLAISIMFTVTIGVAADMPAYGNENLVVPNEQIPSDVIQRRMSTPRDVINSTEIYLNSKRLNIPKSTSDIEALKNQLQQWEQKKQQTMGGVDTGGGTIVQTSSGAIGLLDFYLYNRNAFNDRTLITNNIVPGKSYQKVGIGLLSVDSNPLWRKTLFHIEKWNKSSPILANEMLEALSQLVIYFQKDSFSEKPLELYIPPSTDLHPSQLMMAAVFYGRVGVSLDYNLLKQLPEKHQMGLLIHEALRFINWTGQLQFTNEDIQKITAYMADEPRPGFSLDGYLSGNVLQGLIDHYSAMKSIQTVSQKVCRIKRFDGLFCDVTSDLSEDRFIQRFQANRNSFFSIFTQKYIGTGPFPYPLQEQEEDAGLDQEISLAKRNLQRWEIGSVLRMGVYSSAALEMKVNAMRFR